MIRPVLHLLLSVILAGPALAQREREREHAEMPRLSVSGNAEVRVAPDEARVRLGVTRQASTAQTAQDEVNQAAQGILAALGRLGVKPEQIQTAQLTLTPVYAPQRPNAPEEPRIVAYRASNVVSIRLDRLSLIGPIIDAGLKAGANQLEGVHFGLRDDGPARERALRAAAEAARRKARAIADALELRLVSIHEVQEQGVGIQPPPHLRGEAMLARAGASTPVAPGEVTVSAAVTIQYRIQGR